MFTLFLAFAFCADSDLTDDVKEMFDSTRKAKISEVKHDIEVKKHTLGLVLAGRLTIGSAGNPNSAAIARQQIADAEKLLKSLVNNDPPFVPYIDIRSSESIGRLTFNKGEIVQIMEGNIYIVQCKTEDLLKGPKIAIQALDGVAGVKEGMTVKLTKVYQVMGSYRMNDAKQTTLPKIRTLNISEQDLAEWSRSTKASKK